MTISDPTATEITAVRARLKKIGDTTTVLPDADITIFWKEIVAEVQAETGKSYDGDNYLWIACIAWGTAYDAIMDISASLLISKDRQLGDFRITEQGLNWNVGIFEALRMMFQSKFNKLIDMIDTGKYYISSQGSQSDNLELTLAKIMQEA